MQTGRFIWLQIFSGIFLLVAGALLNGSLAASVDTMSGRYSFSKVTANLKNQLDPKEQHGFTLGEMFRLEQFLNNNVIAYNTGATMNTVTFDNRSFPIQITGVNHHYPEFNRFKLLQGAFWNETGDDQCRMVVVIDEELAWDIFKNTRVVGRVLQLFNQSVRIIGVIAKDNNFFEWLTHSGVPKLYLPAATLLSLDPQARITALEWHTEDTSNLDFNKTVLSNALQKTGKNPTYYNITDWNIKKVIITQKSRLFTLIIGIIIMILLLRFSLWQFQAVYITIKEGCRYEYFGKVLKLKADLIGKATFKILLTLCVISTLWRLYSFTPYIPPYYIPDELINIAYYLDLFQNHIRAQVANLGYIPSHSEQILYQAEIMTNWLFIIGLAGGLLLMYSGFAQLKVAKTGPDGIMLRCGLGMLGAVFLTVVLVWLVGISLVIDLRHVFMIWALVFGKTMDRKRSQEPEAGSQKFL